jgi:hydroxymethylpyrimidine/phosphomethylpyrimidine kinase
MRARLFPLAAVITPNIPEAATLCGTAPATSRQELLQQASSLLSMGVRAVLLKGGHASGAEAVDLLLTAQGSAQWLTSARLEARCRGTGCALASAVAAGLASGQSVEDACRAAKKYVSSMLAARAS